MINTPYIKKFDDTGFLNPITKEKPYLHKFKSARGKSKKSYIPIHNPATGEFIGKVKPFGNNRINTSVRKNKNSRQYFN